MSLREEIIADIEKLPENVLPKLLEVINELRAREAQPTLMERLRKITIDAPPDFSRNIDLYMSGEKKFEDVD